MGLVFNIQRFSVHDGSGIRTVVFLKGCPLDCLWCHNPEGKSLEPQLMFNPEQCIGCGECAVCPAGAHTVADGVHTFAREKCVRCGKCAAACPTGALKMAGQEMSAGEVMEQVLRDRPFYERSGGGMTLSGGDPCFQHAFSAELLRLAHENRIDTAMETSGFMSPEVLARLAADTDTFLWDFKLYDPELHKKYTGVPLEPILANLAALNEMGKAVILRCPLIPGVNAVPEHVLAAAALSHTYPCIREIHFLPYHRLGIPKEKRLGIAGRYDTEEKPDTASLLALCGEHAACPVQLK